MLDAGRIDELVDRELDFVRDSADFLLEPFLASYAGFDDWEADFEHWGRSRVGFEEFGGLEEGVEGRWRGQREVEVQQALGLDECK